MYTYIKDHLTIVTINYYLLFFFSESKLSRLKGRHQISEASAKDLLKGLAESRERQMQKFLETNAEESTNVQDVSTPDEGAMDQLQRRLHPERQALNEEEKKALIENDELAKMWQQLNNGTQIILHSPQSPDKPNA
jgi:hypothetical protein